MEIRGVLLFIASLVTCTICQAVQTTATTNGTTTPQAGGGVKDATVPAAVTCIVQEPLYNATFDLNGLRSTTTHTFSLPTGGDFSFNMCGGLNPMACNNVSGVAACHKGTDGKELILGHQSADAVMVDSLIYFKYVGEKCAADTTRNYTLEVVAECDYNNEADPISLIKRLPCEFMLRYKSSKACMQPRTTTTTKTQCQFALEGGRILDLGQLPRGNQRVSGEQQDFIVSLCRPVIYTPTSACPPDTTFCAYDKKQKKFTSVGGLTAELSQDKESVALVYGSETPCSTVASMNMSSIIEFKCDPKQTNRINYLGARLCTHLFEWYSPVGCETRQACVATDPNSGFTYDLSSLSSQSYNVTGPKGVYYFGVCAGHAECLDKAGACKDGLSMGMTSSALTYNETGYPFLLYGNGAPCKPNNQSTRIEFKCAESAEEDNKPFVLEDSECRLVIQLATQLACPSKISCKDTFQGQDFDLTPLMSSTNYVAEMDAELKKRTTSGANKDAKFYLNVCRPLAPQYGLSCQGGSAVCRANMVDGKPENETSLGFPDISLTVVNSSDNVATPQLKYLRGGACPTHATEKATSTIQFTCNAKVGRGRPVLKSIEDECDYLFEWETNVICQRAQLEYVNCTLSEKATGASFSLRDVGSSGNVTLTGNNRVDLCALADSKAHIDYYSQLVFLEGSATTTTDKNQTIRMEVTLECRGQIKRFDTMNGHDGLHNYTATYIDPSVCKLFNVADTGSTGAVTLPPTESPVSTATKVTTLAPVAGPTEPTKAPNNNNSSTEKPDPSSNNTDSTTAASKAAPPPPPERSGMSAWGITGVVFLMCCLFVLVGYVARSPVRRAKVMSLFRRKNVAVSYTRVTNEASLLMTPAGLSESDDELLV